MKHRKFVGLLSLIIVLFATGCERHYYYVHHEHSHRYYHRHHTDVDIDIRH